LKAKIIHKIMENSNDQDYITLSENEDSSEEGNAATN
jgi:hypothetical protein